MPALVARPNLFQQSFCRHRYTFCRHRYVPQASLFHLRNTLLCSMMRYCCTVFCVMSSSCDGLNRGRARVLLLCSVCSNSASGAIIKESPHAIATSSVYVRERLLKVKFGVCLQVCLLQRAPRLPTHWRYRWQLTTTVITCRQL
jgi:hypothetical protein